MGLLQPEAGLLFWMCLSFGVVFLVLAKYALPVVLRSIDERKEFIDRQLGVAEEAERRLAAIESEQRELTARAEAERAAILRDAATRSSEIMSQTRADAAEERARLIAEARKAATEEGNAIIRKARHEVAMLAVSISEKLLREQFADPASQTRLAERLADEIDQPRKSS